ncbi:hypothetical protein C5S39_14005 [Candidatus Methanophagaceae archaeon]|nr:hypothetical protein C5S39_14005 [Methanophagales archaeon]
MQLMNSDKNDKKRVVTLFACIAMALVFLSAGCATATATATLPEEAWSKTFSGSGEDAAWSVQQTSDEGYIIAGITKYSKFKSNVWVVKTKSNGDKQWDQEFGGSKHDSASSVQQTSDGYIIAGTTFSFGADWRDVWLIKINSNGKEQWDKTFGGSSGDWAYSVQQTTDNGFIVAGGTHSYGAGWADVWLVKTDSNGYKMWDKTFGGTDTEEAYVVQQTSDEGYILAGRTTSYGAGSGDAWLLKTDSHGNEEWNKTFGGVHDDWARALNSTLDGGYILAGTTTSYGAGSWDAWLVKTDSNGDEEWSVTFGNTNVDEGYSVQQTKDGGYILAGCTGSYGAGSWDAWLVKTNSDGDEQWNKTFGGTGPDGAYSVQQTSDSGYILAGDTGSFGAGSHDFWLIKVRAEGNTTNFFDTGPGTYPSCSGTHTGELTPAQDLKVSKLYTYPCAGTGGHSESIELHEGSELIASGTWNGYQSDWHNITLHNETGASYVTLLKDRTYNYAIKTGSYPQIIHRQTFTNEYGEITCAQFTDANGVIYDDRIPAIRLV